MSLLFKSAIYRKKFTQSRLVQKGALLKIVITVNTKFYMFIYCLFNDELNTKFNDTWLYFCMHHQLILAYYIHLFVFNWNLVFFQFLGLDAWYSIVPSLSASIPIALKVNIVFSVCFYPRLNLKLMSA